MGRVTESRIVLPVPEPEPPAPRLPVVALLAPAGVALGLWVLTGQAMALVFAALGPVGALAAYGDQRWVRRRERRRSADRWAARVAACRERIDRELAAERTRRDVRHPGARAILSGRTGALDPGSTALVLGRSRVPSALDLAGADGSLDPLVEDRLAELIAYARTVEAPIVAPPGSRVAVVGRGALARACWRAIALPLVAGGAAPVSASGAPGEVWLGDTRLDADVLPDDRDGERSVIVVEVPESDASVRGQAPRLAAAAFVSQPSLVPPGYDVVIRLSAGAARIERHPDERMIGPLAMEPISDVEAAAWAMSRQTSGVAQRSRLDNPELAQLMAGARESVRTSAGVDGRPGGRDLACVPAVTSDGPFTVDLVRDGPHALVAGTTGSGKSELLVSWMLALAAAHPPDQVAILLVDFKGGAAFAPLRELPHVVGIVTDLDAEHAERALESLRAELRRRERALAAAGARAIEEIELERLVVVIDEFAALLDTHPDLQPLLADLAARGRSLGIHLVLCTQRPSGVVRDAVLANIDLRICLRVNNETDSRAVVATPGAARIEAAFPGRAFVRRAGGDPELAQFAVARADDVVAVERRWLGHARPRRPWVEPLPSRLDRRDLPDDGAEGWAFGLLDRPDEQCTSTARWFAPRDGSVLVLGARGSGRSTALAALGAHVIASRPELAWDAIADLAEALDRDEPPPSVSGPTMVAIDDLDALLPRFGLEHRTVVIERIARLLREGPARGLHVAVSATRLGGDAQPLVALFPSVLLLRHGSRHEWILSGGEGADAHTSGPPGSGRWHGHRIQVVAAPSAPVIESDPRTIELDDRRPWAVVVGAPTDARHVPDRVRVPCEAVTVGLPLPREAMVVGSVDEWSSRWGLLASLREDAEVLLLGCTAADVRALTRTRVPPPPLPPGRSWGWRWGADGELRRVRLAGDAVGHESTRGTMDSASPYTLAVLNR